MSPHPYSYLTLDIFLSTLATDQERLGNDDAAAELRRRAVQAAVMTYDLEKSAAEVQRMQDTLRRVSAEIARAA